MTHEKKIDFEDGSSVEWMDKETVKYSRSGKNALVWVDYEPGFFSSGRIIRSGEILGWQNDNGETISSIDPEEKKQIVDKIVAYYEKLGKKISVE